MSKEKKPYNKVCIDMISSIPNQYYLDKGYHYINLSLDNAKYGLEDVKVLTNNPNTTYNDVLFYNLKQTLDNNITEDAEILIKTSNTHSVFSYLIFKNLYQNMQSAFHDISDLLNSVHIPGNAENILHRIIQIFSTHLNNANLFENYIQYSFIKDDDEAKNHVESLWNELKNELVEICDVWSNIPVTASKLTPIDQSCCEKFSSILNKTLKILQITYPDEIDFVYQSKNFDTISEVFKKESLYWYNNYSIANESINCLLTMCENVIFNIDSALEILDIVEKEAEKFGIPIKQYSMSKILTDNDNKLSNETLLDLFTFNADNEVYFYRQILLNELIEKLSEYAGENKRLHITIESDAEMPMITKMSVKLPAGSTMLFLDTCTFFEDMSDTPNIEAVKDFSVRNSCAIVLEPGSTLTVNNVTFNNVTPKIDHTQHLKNSKVLKKNNMMPEHFVAVFNSMKQALSSSIACLRVYENNGYKDCMTKYNLFDLLNIDTRSDSMDAVFNNLISSSDLTKHVYKITKSLQTTRDYQRELSTHSTKKIADIVSKILIQLDEECMGTYDRTTLEALQRGMQNEEIIDIEDVMLTIIEKYHNQSAAQTFYLSLQATEVLLPMLIDWFDGKDLPEYRKNAINIFINKHVDSLHIAKIYTMLKNDTRLEVKDFAKEIAAKAINDIHQFKAIYYEADDEFRESVLDSVSTMEQMLLATMFNDTDMLLKALDKTPIQNPDIYNVSYILNYHVFKYIRVDYENSDVEYIITQEEADKIPTNREYAVNPTNLQEYSCLEHFGHMQIVFGRMLSDIFLSYSEENITYRIRLIEILLKHNISLAKFCAAHNIDSNPREDITALSQQHDDIKGVVVIYPNILSQTQKQVYTLQQLGYVVIGDGYTDIDNEFLTQELQKYNISEKTPIHIVGHGLNLYSESSKKYIYSEMDLSSYETYMKHNGGHYISTNFSNKKHGTYTPDILKAVQAAAPGQKLNVHVWSCQSGVLENCIEDAEMQEGSTVIIHASEESILSHVADVAMINIAKYDSENDPSSTQRFLHILPYAASQTVRYCIIGRDDSFAVKINIDGKALISVEESRCLLQEYANNFQEWLGEPLQKVEYTDDMVNAFRYSIVAFATVIGFAPDNAYNKAIFASIFHDIIDYTPSARPAILEDNNTLQNTGTSVLREAFVWYKEQSKMEDVFLFTNLISLNLLLIKSVDDFVDAYYRIKMLEKNLISEDEFARIIVQNINMFNSYGGANSPEALCTAVDAYYGRTKDTNVLAQIPDNKVVVAINAYLFQAKYYSSSVIDAYNHIFSYQKDGDTYFVQMQNALFRSVHSRVIYGTINENVDVLYNDTNYNNPEKKLLERVYGLENEYLEQGYDNEYDLELDGLDNIDAADELQRYYAAHSESDALIHNGDALMHNGYAMFYYDENALKRYYHKRDSYHIDKLIFELSNLESESVDGKCRTFYDVIAAKYEEITKGDENEPGVIGIMNHTIDYV